jgi:hypothetical protein
MLQRFDLAKNDKTNRLSIKEHAVIETKSRARNNYKPIKTDYVLLHEVSYDGDMIRTAIGEGQKSLISELRSEAFYPIYPCAEILAVSVTDLFNGNSESAVEVFFDDRTTLSTYEGE